MHDLKCGDLLAEIKHNGQKSGEGYSGICCFYPKDKDKDKDKTKVPLGDSVLVSLVPIVFVWQKALYEITDVCIVGFHMLKKNSFANEENNALNMTVGYRGNKMDFSEKELM